MQIQITYVVRNAGQCQNFTSNLNTPYIFSDKNGKVSCGYFFAYLWEENIFFSMKWWEKHHHNLLKAKQSSIKIYLKKWKSYYINNFMVPTAFSLYSSKQPFSDYIIKTAHYDHLLRSKLLFSKSACILSYSLFVC